MDFLWSIVGFLQAYNGAVTAVATVAIGIFTFFLVRVSNRQAKLTRDAVDVAKASAEIAELQVRTAVRLELPVLHALSPELLSISGHIGEGSYVSQILDGIPYENCAISSMEFRNDGRTAAFPINVKIGFAVARALPTIPIYLRTISCPPGSIIRPNDREIIELDYEIALTDHEREELHSGSVLWVWCSLMYEDFMREPHDEGFSWRWAKEPQDAICYFIPLARPRRNYVTN